MAEGDSYPFDSVAAYPAAEIAAAWQRERPGVPVASIKFTCVKAKDFSGAAPAIKAAATVRAAIAKPIAAFFIQTSANFRGAMISCLAAKGTIQAQETFVEEAWTKRPAQKFNQTCEDYGAGNDSICPREVFMNSVVGTFKTRSEAAGAASALHSAGIPPDRINLLSPGATAKQVQSVPVTDAEKARLSDINNFRIFFHAMLERGIYLPPSQFEALFVSAAHSDADISRTIEAARESFAIALS